MPDQKQQLLERLKTANNILVAVSADPSVDQLAAAIGLTLALNKAGKQATAVFSGKVPSTIEFLQPEKTLEKNTDSLRDFIIALDKAKADKLRYKVEDNHVKIFITPYRTSLSEKDLNFSQGDFNVEVVVALGVEEQKDLDRAITAHGRILHDATVVSMTNGHVSKLGTIDWDNPDASSLSEMAADLAQNLGQNSIDGQIATALLTGIVAETERFRNEKTTPQAMNIGSVLMAAGANQQLIANKLEAVEEVNLQDADRQSEPEPESESDSNPSSDSDEPEADNDTESTPDEGDEAPEEASVDIGSLSIDHGDAHSQQDKVTDEQPSDDAAPDEEPQESEENGEGAKNSDDSSTQTGGINPFMMPPPPHGGSLTANTEPEQLDPATDPLSKDNAPEPVLNHHAVSNEQPNPMDYQPVPSEPRPEENLPSDLPSPIGNDAPSQSLAQLENTVQEASAPAASMAPPQFNPPMPPPMPPQSAPSQPSDQQPVSSGLGEARDAVSDALASITSEGPQPPLAALNAQPVFDINHGTDQSPTVPGTDTGFTMPDNLVPPAQPPVDNTAAPANNPAAPPAVPPPFMPGMDGSLPTPQPPAEQQNGTQPPAGPNNPFNLPPS